MLKRSEPLDGKINYYDYIILCCEHYFSFTIQWKNYFASIYNLKRSVALLYLDQMCKKKANNLLNSVLHPFLRYGIVSAYKICRLRESSINEPFTFVLKHSVTYSIESRNSSRSSEVEIKGVSFLFYMSATRHNFLPIVEIKIYRPTLNLYLWISL